MAEALEKIPEGIWQELRQYMTLDKVGQIRRQREGGMFVCNGYAVANPHAEFREVYDGKRLPPLPACLTSPSPVCRVQLKRPEEHEEMTAPNGPDDPSAAWLSFPYTKQAARSALKRLGAASLEECLVCHAESAWVPNLEGLIQPDSDLDMLQTLAKRLTELREQGRLRTYKAALYFTDCPELGYAADLCQNLNCFVFYPEYVQPSDYARMVLTRKYGLTDQTFYNKVDLNAFGSALMEAQGISTTPYGYMHSSGQLFQYEYAQYPNQAMSGLRP